jgi:hypothetical protein
MSRIRIARIVFVVFALALTSMALAQSKEASRHQQRDVSRNSSLPALKRRR